MADALPLVHGLLDEAVRLLSEAVRELGVCRKRTSMAWPARRAHPAALHSEQSQDEIPACPGIVRSLGR